jgi:hypothetical protein
MVHEPSPAVRRDREDAHELGSEHKPDPEADWVD